MTRSCKFDEGEKEFLGARTRKHVNSRVKNDWEMGKTVETFLFVINPWERISWVISNFMKSYMNTKMW